ncbi:MAG: FGGY family carbohydrate kinase [Bacillota bacterium]
MAYLLGIDVGTTRTKALIIDEDGRMKALAAERTEVVNLPDGGAVHQPESLWRSVVSVIRQTLVHVESHEIAGVAVASFGEAGVPVDKAGRPTHPVLAWHDQRPGDTCERLVNRLGREFLYQVTGLPPNPIFSVFKILWLQENVPEAMARANKWLSVDGYVNYRLSGAMVMDFTQASRTLALDIRKGTWATSIVEEGDIAGLLPSVVESGTVIGEVSAAAAEETGLMAHTPVVAGGHDHICASLAVGCTEPGYVSDSMGTAESVLSVQATVPAQFAAGRMLRFGRYVVPGRFYGAAALTASGATLDWAVATLAESRGKGDNGVLIDNYAAILARAETRRPGAGGILFLPHLLGGGPPEWDPASRGAFLGLRPCHAADDMLRAVVEGLSFEFRYLLDEIEQATGVSSRVIRATGGGAKNPLWLRVKAAVTGLPIEIPQVLEATAMGAALLAGLGVGLYSTPADAVQRTLHVAEVYEPDQSLMDTYAPIFDVYKGIYPSVSAIHRQLEQVQMRTTSEWLGSELNAEGNAGGLRRSTGRAG